MFDRLLPGLQIECSDKFCVMQHLLLHACVLAADGTVYHRRARFHGDAASGAGRDRTIYDSKTRLIGSYITQNLLNKPIALEWKADVHDVATLDWSR